MGAVGDGLDRGSLRLLIRGETVTLRHTMKAKFFGVNYRLADTHVIGALVIALAAAQQTTPRAAAPQVALRRRLHQNPRVPRRAPSHRQSRPNRSLGALRQLHHPFREQIHAMSTEKISHKA
jgi:hypothetical protein